MMSQKMVGCPDASGRCYRCDWVRGFGGERCFFGDGAVKLFCVCCLHECSIFSEQFVRCEPA